VKLTEHPILFSAPMVRALLAGRKTQTRCIVKLPADAGAVHIDPGGTIFGPGPYLKVEATAPDRVADMHPRIRCPYGYPGDALWVRETWRCFGGREYEYHRDPESIVYRADRGAAEGTWRPAIFMWRWASRITLEITSVRVERLHAVTEADAWAEGIEEVDGDLDEAAICRAAKVLGCGVEDSRASYGALWAEINGEESLVANPWIWVLDLRRTEAG
jgi:hypothetical protein